MERAPAYSMRALGKRDLPATLLIDGVAWRHVRTHKHDFWAATGFYENDRGERAVLKMGRTEPFMGLPLEWTGRFLCRREVRFYRKLADLPNVPKILGIVGSTGFIHEFASGEPVSRDRPVPDGFFDQLLSLMHELHTRGIAYVDANKPQNILLGDDGRPHLIDFQISWDGHELGNNFFSRWMLKRMHRGDVYHVLKHKKRMRPDELTDAEQQIVARRSTFIRVHRVLTKPYFKFRRTTFKRLRETGRLLPERSK
jgi:RIO-like serine/threonine protein kinase